MLKSIPYVRHRYETERTCCICLPGGAALCRRVVELRAVDARDASIWPIVELPRYVRGRDVFRGEFSRGVKTETRNDEHVRGEEEVSLGVADQLAREGGTGEEEPESVGIHGQG